MQSYSHRSSIVSLKYGLFMFTIIAQALDPCQSQISNSHKYRRTYTYTYSHFLNLDVHILAFSVIKTRSLIFVMVSTYHHFVLFGSLSNLAYINVTQVIQCIHKIVTFLNHDSIFSTCKFMAQHNDFSEYEKYEAFFNFHNLIRNIDCIT